MSIVAYVGGAAFQRRLSLNQGLYYGSWDFSKELRSMRVYDRGFGKYVWRMANGKDGLWEANVGPSCYAKSQGLPVKIWGMFARGRLHYVVLPKDGPTKTAHMNGARYNKVVQTHFSKWRRSRLFPGARLSCQRSRTVSLATAESQCREGRGV